MQILDKVLDYQVEPIKKIIEQAHEAKPKNTVFFGDSLIQSYDLHAYFPTKIYYNCGVLGATTTLLLHLHEYAIKGYSPEEVVLLVGTNDLSEQYQVGVLDVVYNVYKLVEIMNAKYDIKKIHLISPLPIDETKQSDGYKTNMQLNLLRKEYKSLASEFDNVTFIDVYPFFLENEQMKSEFTTDGLHLNKKGYVQLTEILKESL